MYSENGENSPLQCILFISMGEKNGILSTKQYKKFQTNPNLFLGYFTNLISRYETWAPHFRNLQLCWSNMSKDKNSIPSFWKNHKNTANNYQQSIFSNLALKIFGKIKNTELFFGKLVPLLWLYYKKKVIFLNKLSEAQDYQVFKDFSKL